MHDRTTELVYSFKNADAKTYQQLFQIWEDGTRTPAHIKGLQVQYLVQPQPVTNGTNSLGQPAGETDRVIGLVTIAFDNAADEEPALRGLRGIVQDQLDILQRAGLHLPFQYLNYADKSQDPFGGYGEEMRTRLRAVSRKYDPAGMFQKRVPGGFKLFE